jgi:hypothetical protein
MQAVRLRSLGKSQGRIKARTYIVRETKHSLRPTSVHTSTHAQTPSSLFRSADSYRLQLLTERVEPERLPYEAGSLQLLGFRRQHQTSSNIDGGFEVSIYEPFACIDAG